MKISLIAGMASNHVIGNNNTLPRHYSEDLKHFKAITTGHTIIMGANTYFSIGKPLPNRRNIVLTKNPIDGVECFSSIDAMMTQLEQEGLEEVFVIGGASVYKQFLDIAELLYLTEIKKAYEGDTFFPEFSKNFSEVSREVFDEFDFVVYKRK